MDKLGIPVRLLTCWMTRHCYGGRNEETVLDKNKTR
jgi:hypothetical protein